MAEQDPTDQPSAADKQHAGDPAAEVPVVDGGSATDDQLRAAAKRRAAADPSDREQGAIDALKAERLGYERRGLPDRVAQVDTELAKFGVEVDSPKTTRSK